MWGEVSAPQTPRPGVLLVEFLHRLWWPGPRGSLRVRVHIPESVPCGGPEGHSDSLYAYDSGLRIPGSEVRAPNSELRLRIRVTLMIHLQYSDIMFRC